MASASTPCSSCWCTHARSSAADGDSERVIHPNFMGDTLPETADLIAINGWPKIGAGRNQPVNTDALPAPGFHHLHLNSVDPDAAIGFYTRQFLTTRKITWGGQPALASPNDVLILFSRVATAPPTSPQTAIWHFGWHVPDSRATLERFRNQPEVKLLPLYTGADGGSVFVSSDTWPGAAGVLGRTQAQI